jgi:FkbM family methyltransferase
MFLSLIESVVRRPLRWFISPRRRSQIKSLMGLPHTVLNSEWKILNVIGPISEPHVMLDIGAHHGWFFHCWLDWCPNAQVHAFEPYPESFQAIQHVYGKDPRVTLCQVGVGAAAGDQAFNVLNDSKVSNSFLAPDRKVWNSVRYNTGAVTTISAPVTTVDLYVRQQHMKQIYLMKIDVQGYEMNVLRGAEQTLPIVDHIFVEAGIQRLYEGAPRFSDVFEFLTARGFHLMSLRTWHRGNHMLMETDMLFRRNGLEPPVDESVIKVTEHVD